MSHLRIQSVLGALATGMLAAITLGGAEALSGASAGADAPPPNIIIILADDLGYGDPGTYGGWVATPQLDRLARGGLSFTDFHANSSVCSPTRAALMTGRYQQRVGIVDVIASHLDTPGLDPSEFTIPRMMKQQGYATALFGKWHLGSKPEQNPIYHGFDEFRGYLPGAMDYFIHQKSWYNGLKLEDQPGYTTHHITSNAVQFIERHRDQPFFLYVAHQAVHLPFQTPDDTPDKRQPIPEGQRWSRERIRPKYKVMLEEMDKGIGQILDTLERNGLSQRTLVFFFSDNGAISAGSNVPFRGGKFSLYEGGSRVPAIACWPGHIKPNTRTEQLAAGMDLLPTLAEILGAKIPGGRALDGVSLRGVLLNGEKLPPRRIFFGYEPKLGTALRDEQFKGILKHGGQFELYDLSTDVGEKTNIATAFPDRAAEMRRAIETWRDQFQPASK